MLVRGCWLIGAKICLEFGVDCCFVLLFPYFLLLILLSCSLYFLIPCCFPLIAFFVPWILVPCPFLLPVLLSCSLYSLLFCSLCFCFLVPWSFPLITFFVPCILVPSFLVPSFLPLTHISLSFFSYGTLLALYPSLAKN